MKANSVDFRVTSNYILTGFGQCSLKDAIEKLSEKSFPNSNCQHQKHTKKRLLKYCFTVNLWRLNSFLKGPPNDKIVLSCPTVFSKIFGDWGLYHKLMFSSSGFEGEHPSYLSICFKRRRATWLPPIKNVHENRLPFQMMMMMMMMKFRHFLLVYGTFRPFFSSKNC